MSVRKIFIISSILITFVILAVALINPYFLLGFLLVGPIIFIGVRDITQKKQTIRRNFPIVDDVGNRLYSGTTVSYKYLSDGCRYAE